MNILAEAQERARHFNESEAIQQDYRRRRVLRKLRGDKRSGTSMADWTTAVQTKKQVRAVGVMRA